MNFFVVYTTFASQRPRSDLEEKIYKIWHLYVLCQLR